MTVTTSSAGGSGGGCVASYVVTNQWNSGFTANVTVTNNGSAAGNGWKVAWNWGGNQQIVNVWNGVESRGGQGETVTNASFNGAARTRRQHLVRLPGELLRHQRVPDAQLHAELTELTG